jgi:hypothetical protein
MMTSIGDSRNASRLPDWLVFVDEVFQGRKYVRRTDYRYFLSLRVKFGVKLRVGGKVISN